MHRGGYPVVAKGPRRDVCKKFHLSPFYPTYVKEFKAASYVAKLQKFKMSIF